MNERKVWAIALAFDFLRLSVNEMPRLANLSAILTSSTEDLEWFSQFDINQTLSIMKHLRI